MQSHTVSIFNYTDYRLFLRDHYKWHKENTRKFSHRRMAAELGFTSPNFLKLVMDGKRNISKESQRKVAAGLGLNKRETEYFSYLVFFNQARHVVDKNYYFGLIAHLRTGKNVTKVLPDQYDYFSEWYHPAVREIAAGKKEPLDYDALAVALGKKISPAQIKKSVKLLIRLGLLGLDETNTYVHSSPLLNTENELRTFAVKRYHKEVLAVARVALDEIPPEKRENSHLTVKISPGGFAGIKRRIQEFREELLRTVACDEGPGNVYHINFQMYPLEK